MKRIGIFIFALLALAFTTATLYSFAPAGSQDPNPTELSTAIDLTNQDASLITPTVDFWTYYSAFGALLPLVVAIVAFLASRFNMNRTWKQLTAWIVSILLTYAGWWMKIGYLTDLSWWLALIHGLALGLAANGFFDIAIIKAILNALFPPKKIR